MYLKSTIVLCIMYKICRDCLVVLSFWPSKLVQSALNTSDSMCASICTFSAWAFILTCDKPGVVLKITGSLNTWSVSSSSYSYLNLLADDILFCFGFFVCLFVLFVFFFYENNVWYFMWMIHMKYQAVFSWTNKTICLLQV